MKRFLRIIFLSVCFIFLQLSSCSQTNPCDISIVFPQHSIVEQGGWQEIYFIPYSNEYSGCNDFMDMPQKQLEDISETYSTIPIILSPLTGKGFSNLNTNRYYIVVRAKDLKCDLHWERCTDVDLETECRASLEIEMNNIEEPQLCGGLCVEGNCEIIECTGNEKCINNNICDGDEYCGEDNICHSGNVVENGTQCNIDNALEEICISGQCVERRCGNGFVEYEIGEECDPPNVRCGQDCKWINGDDADVDSDTDIENDISLDIEQDISNDILFDTAEDLYSDFEQDLLIDTNNCIDNDGDNYGENCINGPDCDDNEINCTDNCDVDVDNDQIPDCRDLCVNCICPHEVGFYDTPGLAYEVAVSGSYAFVADHNSGLRIIDISNVNSPQEVGFYDTYGDAYGVTVSNSYAFVAAWYEVQIIDISNVTNPQKVSEIYPRMSCYVLQVAVSVNYAFVANYPCGLGIIDISNITDPQGVRFYDTYGSANGVTVSGSYAFVANGYDQGFQIIDISNPANPHGVGFYNPQGITNTSKVAVSDNYVFLLADNGLGIIDISNVSSPHEVGFYDTPAIANGVAVSGSYAFVADNNSGLRIIDISNVSSPQEAGFYDTPGLAYGVAVSNNYAFVADESSGLRIVSLECE